VEAGLRLYGQDIDQQTDPYEAGLGWTVAIGKPDFIGRAAVTRRREEPGARRFIGLTLEQGPVPRPGQELFLDGRPVGRVTSGAYSPWLSKPLGMGYVEPAAAAPGTSLTLAVRGQSHRATVVKLPFWKGPDPSAVVRGTIAGARENAAGA
jgi:aminomethyltransferase